MCSSAHLSFLILFACSCGLIEVLSMPTTSTPATTIIPTTIRLNNTNSTLESDEPVILAEGDVDVFILNLGGILSDEEEFYNSTDGKNYTVSEILSLLRRDTAAQEEEGVSDDITDEFIQIYSAPKSNEEESLTTTVKAVTGSKDKNLPLVKERGRRETAQLLSPGSQIISSSKEETSSTTISTLINTHIPLNSIQQKSLTNDKSKQNIYGFDKETHKTDPTMSFLMNQQNSHRQHEIE